MHGLRSPEFSNVAHAVWCGRLCVVSGGRTPWCRKLISRAVICAVSDRAPRCKNECENQLRTVEREMPL